MINGIINTFSVSPEILQESIKTLNLDLTTINNQIDRINNEKYVIIFCISAIAAVALSLIIFDSSTKIPFIAISSLTSILASLRIIESPEEKLITTLFNKTCQKIEKAKFVDYSILKGSNKRVLHFCSKASADIKQQYEYAIDFIRNSNEDINNRSRGILGMCIKMRIILINLKRHLENITNPVLTKVVTD